jgi:ATP-dependent Clp protease protease subunit
MGSVLSLAAAKGRRFATPHSRIMVHQPLINGVVQGQATDLEIQAKEIEKTHNLLISIYQSATGKSYDEIKKLLDRDTWMTAKEALALGLLDGIVETYLDL